MRLFSTEPVRTAWALFIPVVLLVLLIGCFPLGSSNSPEQPNPSAPPSPSSPNNGQQQPGKPGQPDPSVEPGGTPPPIDKPPVEPDPITKLLQSMTLEEKIGQMILAGVSGTELSPETERFLSDVPVGGLILYKPNIVSANQTLRLLDQLKKANRSSIPLLLSVDQEGGTVSRLPAEITKIPSARDIAKTGDSKRAKRIGAAMSEALKAFGFNVNYAPVLDIDSNPANPVIGARSYGSSAALVSEYGIQTMKGMQEQQIIPVVKHFPGHGDTSVDSHLELPIVNKTIEQLRQLELKPFNEAIRSGADAVMIAHILLPKLDPDYPSSLSPVIVDGLLRDELGFDGVVITDDMTMGAIVKNYELGKASVQAVKAGVDIVLVAHGYDNAALTAQAIQQAVESGDIPPARIDQSVARILQLKDRYKLSDKPSTGLDIENINETIQSALKPEGAK